MNDKMTKQVLNYPDFLTQKIMRLENAITAFSMIEMPRPTLNPSFPSKFEILNQYPIHN